MTMFVIIINISDTPFDIEHLDFEWFLGTKFGFWMVPRNQIWILNGS